MEKSYKKEIPAEKINAFCKKEFGTLPTTGPTPGEVYHADDNLRLEQRLVNISEKCYGQRCSLEDAGYMGCRLEMFL